MAPKNGQTNGNGNGSYMAPWLETEECTACDECVNLNGKIFAYNDDKKAYIKDPKAGPYEDLVKGRPGQYLLRLLDNKKGHDTTYPGVEVLPDARGTFVVTTYGHWEKGEAPYIMSTRFDFGRNSPTVS